MSILDAGSITVRTPTCSVCGRSEEMQVLASGLAAWRGGMVIQRAFPELNNAERELLLTGMIHHDCWKQIFSEEED